ncbi:MAG: BrnT family toxin [Acidobacteriaceae bacterium]|jgi:uncharacterized DUF497 family protein
MFYEWDLQKDDENFRKHDVRLAEGIPALEDPSSEFWTDDRYDYGEDRVITLGRAPSGILYVVSTELAEDLTRIISVRKAEAYEKDWYVQGRP